VAFDSTQEYQGYIPNRLRRLDNLEANLRREPQRVPGAYRTVLYGAVSKVGHHYNLVWAWIILTVVFIGGATTIGIFFFGRNW
jgi:hypothetical protein